MGEDSVNQAIAMLLRVRSGGGRIANLGAAAPSTEAAVWAIQQGVLGALGGTIGGYKCAAPPGKPGTAAIMAAGGIHAEPCKWSVTRGEQIGIETEIAFRLGRDLAPRATPYSQAEVLDAVAGAFPAIELVSSRYRDPKAVSPQEAMADCIAHAGLVYGADVPNWRQRDLKSLTVRQSCGGTVQVEKVGGNPSGDPFVPLVWLANYLPTVGLHLRAGQVVTTGSCTGLLYVDSGQRVTGGFLGFGEVSIDLL